MGSTWVEGKLDKKEPNEELQLELFLLEPSRQELLEVLGIRVL